MSKRKKWSIGFAVVALLVAVLAGFLLTHPALSPKGEPYAEKRVLAMAEAANENDPAKVYDFLTKELRDICSKEEFCKNWEDERTYPYLIPFWIFFRGIEMEPGNEQGSAKFERAARLPGQFEEYGIVYENGGYYIDAFRTIADGSYVEIFERLS